MLANPIKFFSHSTQTLLGSESSRRLALGVVLGMMIGLIPKDSLMVYLFFVLLMFSTANLWCAFFSGLAFHGIGLWLDPISHKLGSLVLTADRFESIWIYLYDLPFVPWTRFNNTVAMGCFLIGLFFAYPVYRISFAFFQHFGHAIHVKLQNTWIYNWLVAPPTASHVEEA